MGGAGRRKKLGGARTGEAVCGRGAQPLSCLSRSTSVRAVEPQAQAGACNKSVGGAGERMGRAISGKRASGRATR
eukprot:355680-Chlamydomonas_euryale.AAC.3